MQSAIETAATKKTFELGTPTSNDGAALAIHLPVHPA
jgi:hypothetical protein